MHKRIASILLVSIMSAGAWGADAPTTGPATAPAGPVDPAGEAALGERLAQLAQINVTAPRPINDTTLKQTAALLEAACKLNNFDPRFPRLRAEACLTLGDSKSAIEALSDCTRIDPTDQLSQIQLVDLYSAQMQGADQKLRHFGALLANEKAISAEVRAHIAYKAARELFDRGQDKEANDMLQKALNLNSMDPDALDLNEQVTRDGPVSEHVMAMLGLLRCNPGQPDVMSQLGQELADEGLVSESINWYSNCFSTNTKLNGPVDYGAYADYVAELLISGNWQGAVTADDSLLGVNPNNAAALYLRLLAVRRGDDKDVIAKSLEVVTARFLENLYSAYRLSEQKDPSSTQPSGAIALRTGDVTAQSATVKATNNTRALAAYTAALTDLAWLQIYFAQQPDDAKPLIDALHTLLPDDDVRFARLEGWSLLVAKKIDEAQVKLSAVSDRDPLSAMGMVQIHSQDEKQKSEVPEQAKTLLNRNPSGLIGAMILDGMRDFSPAIEVTDAGKAAKVELEKFPKDWLLILDKPDSFYMVSCEATRVQFAFDEPMLAVVRLQNMGLSDLAIGPRGVIHPDLCFDAQVRVNPSVSIPAAAYDRLNRRVLLRKGDRVEQLVRLDQPKLAIDVLANNPFMSYPIYFTLITNPATGPLGLAPGPAGERQLVNRLVERAANPFNDKKKKEILDILNGTAGDFKIRILNLLISYAKAMASQGPQNMQQLQQLVQQVLQSTNDASPPVAAWANYLINTNVQGDKRAESLKKMAESTYWPQRLLAAYAIRRDAASDGKPILEKLAEDKEPVVQKYASAALDELAHAATRPATAPAAQPGASSPSPFSLSPDPAAH